MDYLVGRRYITTTSHSILFEEAEVVNGQATCAAKMEIANDEIVTVTEEVDGGVQTVSAKLPMIVTTDLRYYDNLHLYGIDW